MWRECSAHIYNLKAASGSHLALQDKDALVPAIRKLGTRSEAAVIPGFLLFCFSFFFWFASPWFYANINSACVWPLSLLALRWCKSCQASPPEN